MENATKQLTEWAIRKIQTEYPGDVALLVAVGENAVDDDGHGECFDYFVPATARGNELAQTFIIGGVGHDLYPRSWERVERTANLEDSATDTLWKARIVYSRTPEDEARFWALRERLAENLENPGFLYRRALEKIDAAMDFYRTMLFEDALFKLRLGLFYLSERLSTAVAYLNGTYLDDWRAGNLAQLKRLRELPASYLEACQAVVTMEQASPEEIRCLAYRMLQTVRAFAFQKAPEGQEKLSAPSLAGLADWYQEMSLTWRRLRYYCGVQNSELALWHACYLQSELLVVGEEFSLGELDLLGSYDSRDLVPLRERSVELERQIISTLENAGVPIRQYESVGDFFART